MDIISKVTEILKPITSDKGLEIIDISYRREGPKMALRIILDKEGGIGLGECAKVNSELSEELDKEDTISDRYILEVSSPGLDRPIEKEKDFERAIGKLVRITSYGPVNGKNLFIGKLLGMSESAVVLEDDSGVSWEIPREKIARAKLEITIT